MTRQRQGRQSLPQSSLLAFRNQVKNLGYTPKPGAKPLAFRAIPRVQPAQSIATPVKEKSAKDEHTRPFTVITGAERMGVYTMTQERSLSPEDLRSRSPTPRSDAEIAPLQKKFSRLALVRSPAPSPELRPCQPGLAEDDLLYDHPLFLGSSPPRRLESDDDSDHIDHSDFALQNHVPGQSTPCGEPSDDEETNSSSLLVISKTPPQPSTPNEDTMVFSSSPPSSPVAPNTNSSSDPVDQRSSRIQVRIPLSSQQELQTGHIDRCKTLASMMKDINQEDLIEPSGVAVVKSSELALRRFGNKIMIFGPPIATIHAETKDTRPGHTFGTIQELGASQPLMSSISGWRPKATGNPGLLDGAAWVEAVREFCEVVGHTLPANCYDTGRFNTGWKGRYQASHVEKRLALWFVIHHTADPLTGIPDPNVLKELRKRPVPLAATITLDKAPCLDCLLFLAQLKKYTGIEIQVETMKEYGQVMKYKDSTNGARKNKLYPGGDFDVLTEKFRSHKDYTIGGRISKNTADTRRPWFSVRLEDPVDEDKDDEEEQTQVAKGSEQRSSSSSTTLDRAMAFNALQRLRESGASVVLSDDDQDDNNDDDDDDDDDDDSDVWDECDEN